MAPAPSDPDHRATISFNAWLGAILFVLYAMLYAGFIYLNAFNRERMAADSVAGVNLAVVYGLGLIVAAFLVACLYMLLCRRAPVASDTTKSQENL